MIDILESMKKARAELGDMKPFPAGYCFHWRDEGQIRGMLDSETESRGDSVFGNLLDIKVFFLRIVPQGELWVAETPEVLRKLIDIDESVRAGRAPNLTEGH